MPLSRIACASFSSARAGPKPANNRVVASTAPRKRGMRSPRFVRRVLDAHNRRPLEYASHDDDGALYVLGFGLDLPGYSVCAGVFSREPPWGLADRPTAARGTPCILTIRRDEPRFAGRLDSSCLSSRPQRGNSQGAETKSVSRNAMIAHPAAESLHSR